MFGRLSGRRTLRRGLGLAADAYPFLFLPCLMASPKDKAARKQASLHRDTLYVRQGGLCAACGDPVQRRGRQSHVDHVVPLAAGGSGRFRNLQLLCRLCNQRKGAS